MSKWLAEYEYDSYDDEEEEEFIPDINQHDEKRERKEEEEGQGAEGQKLITLRDYHKQQTELLDDLLREHDMQNHLSVAIGKPISKEELTKKAFFYVAHESFEFSVASMRAVWVHIFDFLDLKDIFNFQFTCRSAHSLMRVLYWKQRVLDSCKNEPFSNNRFNYVGQYIPPKVWKSNSTIFGFSDNTDDNDPSFPWHHFGAYFARHGQYKPQMCLNLGLEMFAKKHYRSAIDLLYSVATSQIASSKALFYMARSLQELGANDLEVSEFIWQKKWTTIDEWGAKVSLFACTLRVSGGISYYEQILSHLVWLCQSMLGSDRVPAEQLLVTLYKELKQQRPNEHLCETCGKWFTNEVGCYSRIQNSFLTQHVVYSPHFPFHLVHQKLRSK